MTHVIHDFRFDFFLVVPPNPSPLLFSSLCSQPKSLFQPYDVFPLGSYLQCFRGWARSTIFLPLLTCVVTEESISYSDIASKPPIGINNTRNITHKIYQNRNILSNAIYRCTWQPLGRRTPRNGVRKNAMEKIVQPNTFPSFVRHASDGPFSDFLGFWPMVLSSARDLRCTYRTSHKMMHLLHRILKSYIAPQRRGRIYKTVS